jgi:uncharacterized repeat protein (TIGR01451 family)
MTPSSQIMEPPGKSGRFNAESVTPRMADLSLTKTVDNPTPDVGDTVTFTITVANAGSDAATNVSVNDVLPSGLSYVAGSIAGGDSRSDASAPTLTWTINTLASGASVDLTLQAIVLSSGNYVNVAQVMASDLFDPDSSPANDDGDQSEDDEDAATATPQVADLSLEKTVDNSIPDVGDTVTFTITVANTGPDAATNVSVNDVLPGGLSYVAGSIAGGDAQDDSGAPVLTWSINNLASGTSVDLAFQATILSSGNHTNITQVMAADQYDPDSVLANDDGDQSEDDEDAESVTTQQSADLSLNKTVNDTAPDVGDTVTFTLTLSNAGPDAATNVSVEDVIPDGFSYVAGSIAGGDARDDSGAPTLTWTINTIVSGTSVDLSYQVLVLASGNHTNVAQVMASDQYDPDSIPGNGDGTEDDQDSITAQQSADLSLTKTVDDSTPDVGDTVTFTITVANAGPDAATNVSVNDVLPGGFSYAGGSITGGDARDDTGSPTLTWTIITLASGASVDLTFQAIVLASGNHTNTAQVMDADQFDPDSAPANDDGDQSEDDEDAATVALQVADLSLDKTVNDTNPDVGDTVTFTITVSNAGPDAAANVSVRDVLPSGFSYLGGSIAGGNSRSDASAPTLNWTINNLASGTSVDLTFRATVLASGNHINTAQVMTSDQYDPDSTPGNDDGDQSEDDEDSAAIANINLFDPPYGIKTVNDQGLPQLEWGLVWINNGNADSLRVRIVDWIPEGTTYVEGSLACEARGNSKTISCEYDPLDNMVVWEGIIAADPGATNEAEAKNEVIITFKTTVNEGVDEAENQASAYWDRNGDGVLNNDDDNIRNNTPVLSDDTTTSQNLDPTAWRRELPDEQGTLPNTGIDNRTRLLVTMSMFTIIAGLALLAAGIIMLLSSRRREESQAPVFGWESSRLPYDG